MPKTHPISDFQDEIYKILAEVQVEASLDPRRFTHDEIFSPLRQKITDHIDSSKIFGINYYYAN